jgi:hypothetical protein
MPTSPFCKSRAPPFSLECASSFCGLVPSIGNKCANAIFKRETNQQANCENDFYNRCHLCAVTVTVWWSASATHGFIIFYSWAAKSKSFACYFCTTNIRIGGCNLGKRRSSRVSAATQEGVRGQLPMIGDRSLG